MPKGKFFALDGPEGSAIATQIKRLKEKLPIDNNLLVQEAEGIDFAKQIRELLRHEDLKRTSTVKEVVGPMLERGDNVVLGGYAASAWAIQICGEEQRELEPLFRRIYTDIPGMLKPDAYIIFDLQAYTAFARAKARAEDALVQEQAQLDSKPMKYHLRVQEGFREFGEFARETGSKYFMVDAGQDEVGIFEDLRRHVIEVLRP